MTDLDKAREWAKEGSEEYFTYLTDDSRAAIKVIQSLPDQWIDAEKVREIIEGKEGRPPVTALPELVRDLHNLLTPKLPTLAHMTEEERDERKWAQADMEQHGRGIITCILDDSVQFMKGNGLLITVWEKDYGKVTPLPDLPKLQWPGDEVVETPALPEDERIGAWDEIAGHKFFNDCYVDGVLLDHMIKKLDEVVDVGIVEESNSSEIPKSSPPSPADVPVNEVWKAEIGGKEYTAARIDPDSDELPWVYATKSWIGWATDSKVTLLEKLTPTAPALPEGMRLANHERYGRVVVSPHPYEDGDYVIFRLSALSPSGSLVTFCKENKLTFLDGGN